MGLDIMHYKICEELGNEFVPNLNIVSKTDIELYNTDIDYFEQYWKAIHKYSYVTSFKVAYSQESYKKAKKTWQEWNPAIEVIKGSLELREKLIVELSNRPENKNLHLFVKDEMDWESLNFYRASEIIGFYSKQVGYQRKGVKDEFFETYNYKKTGLSNFVEKSDFENVYNLIGKYYEHNDDEDVKLLKENYKKNFLDKFEEGKSILTISY